MEMVQDPDKFCCLYRLDKREAISLEETERVTLGREECNDVRLQDSKGVSRKHAVLNRLQDGTWTITDLKSSNGVYVNNLKIPPSRPYGLQDRDIIEIGKDAKTTEPAPYRYQFYRKAKVVRQEQEKGSTAPVNDISESNHLEENLTNGKVRHPNKLKLKKGKENDPAKGAAETGARRLTRSMRSAINNEASEKELNSQPSATAHLEVLTTCTDNQLQDTDPCGEHVLNPFLQTPPRHPAMQQLQQTLRRISCSPSSMLRAKLARQEATLRGEMEEKQLHLVTQLLELKQSLEEKDHLQAHQLQELQDQRSQLETQLQQQQACVNELRSKAELQEEMAERLLMTSELLEAKEVQEAELEADRTKIIAEMEQLQMELDAERRKEADLAAKMERRLKEEEELIRQQLNQEIERLQKEKEKATEAQKSLLEEVEKLKLKDQDYEEKIMAERDALQLVMAEKDEEKLTLEAELSLMRHAVDHIEESKKSVQKEQKALQDELEEMKNVVDKMKVESQEQGLKTKKDVLTNMEDVMETELLCAICSELFIKAMSLNCSHSFCALCIEKWHDQKAECPQCRAKIISSVHSLVLDNYINKMVEFLGDEAQQHRRGVLEERAVEERNWKQQKEARSRPAERHQPRQQPRQQQAQVRNTHTNNNTGNNGQQQYNFPYRFFNQNYNTGQTYGNTYYYAAANGADARRFYGTNDGNYWRY